MLGQEFATVNLKDTYFQTPIWEGHRRCPRFAFEGRSFKVYVLPFQPRGMETAPQGGQKDFRKRVRSITILVLEELHLFCHLGLLAVCLTDCLNMIENVLLHCNGGSLS